jgi:uncharacterized protein YlxW (UPF0749 family)
MATHQETQQAAQGTSQSSGSLKTKYLDALQRNVVDPLRKDLEQRQESLRNELRQLDAGGSNTGARRGELQSKIERLSRVSNTIDTELARLQRLRLSDFA